MFYSRIASFAFAVAVAAVLGACGSTPKYAPADDVDSYGYYSTQLSENRYRIVYNGRRSTSLNTSRDYALLRAAELTLREGYDWFRIVERETVSFNEPQPQSGLSYERAHHVERSCGLLSCSQSVRPWTSTRLDMSSDRGRTKHSHALEIVMGKGEPPEDDSDYYQADEAVRSLVESM